MDGYKGAFQGVSIAYGKLAVLSVRWLQHVTGTGGDSESHYWPEHCEICKEIARHISDWGERPNTGLQADLSVRKALPLNQHIPDDSGGAFFVHWSCHDCLPDDFDSSDRCHHCGKPRSDKMAAAKA